MTNYISNLRNISTFAVILVHVVAIYVGNFKNLPLLEWKAANLIDACLRFCVPVFLMISGALLLSKEEPIQTFISKRLKRVVVPFICWNIVYFVYKDYSTGLSLSNFFQKLAQSFTTGSSYHFWYIYLIIGLYLFVPILRKWTIAAKESDLRYFLVIWFVTLCLSKYNISYFPKIELMYFSKYLGYLVAGHYIHHYLTSYSFKIWGIALFIFGIFLTYYLTTTLSISQKTFVGTYYDYLSPNVAITAIGLFLVFRNIKTNTNLITKTLDKVSYGIYLIHIIVLTELKEYIKVSFNTDMTSLLWNIAALSISTYFISFLIIFILSKIPYIKTIVT